MESEKLKTKKKKEIARNINSISTRTLTVVVHAYQLTRTLSGHTIDCGNLTLTHEYPKIRNVGCKL